MLAFRDDKGKQWSVGQELSAGGEGTVYSVAETNAFLAKIYHKPPSSDTQSKLGWMVQNGSEALAKVAAWPSRLLYLKSDRQCRGFLMPRFHQYEPLYHLYHPAQRAKHFPRADFAFLVQAGNTSQRRLTRSIRRVA